MNGKIPFIKLPPSLRQISLHSSVAMPASLPANEAKSARKADEILIKNKSKQLHKEIIFPYSV